MTINPIIPGFNPDPTVCRVGEDFFLATSTFEYFPGIPIYHSKDLVNWQCIGHALTRASQLNMRAVEAGGGVWAPTLRHHKGRWYLAACCVYKWGRRPHLRVKPRGFYVYTDDIWDESTWSDPIYFDTLGIDQDLFFDDDGRVYMSSVMWKTVSDVKDHFESYGVEIDIETGKSLSRPVLLRRSPLINFCAEGPHIYKKGGWYYLLTAEGGTELQHRAMIFRSRYPLGPYSAPPEGVNPLVRNLPDDPSVRQTGHADVFEDGHNRWWAVLLGTRPQKDGLAQLGRETFLVPVDWPEDGWPTFNNEQSVSLTVDAPGLPDSSPCQDWLDTFRSTKLSSGWYFLRTPLKQDYSLTEFPGSLSLRGNAYTIDMQESPAILLRKQTAYSGLWSARLSFSPSDPAEEAGIVAFWSRYSYISLFVRSNASGELEVAIRWVDEETDETKTEIAGTVPRDPLELGIRATPTHYTCMYRVVDQPWADIITLSAKVIQRMRQFESPYTGAHFGLFAQNTDNFQSLTPAIFHQASFTH